MHTTDILMNETENKTREKYKKTDALLICPLWISGLDWRQDMSCLNEDRQGTDYVFNNS